MSEPTARLVIGEHEVRNCPSCGALPGFKRKEYKRGGVAYMLFCRCKTRTSPTIEDLLAKWNGERKHELKQPVSKEVESVFYKNAPVAKKRLNDFHDGRLTR